MDNREDFFIKQESPGQSDDENEPTCGIKEEIEENNIGNNDVRKTPASISSATTAQRTVTIVVNAQHPQKPPANVKKSEVLVKNFNTFEPPKYFFHLIHKDTSSEADPLSTDKERLSCPACSQTAPNKNLLHKHIINTHPLNYGLANTIKCAHCKLNFDDLNKLGCHLDQTTPCSPQQTNDSVGTKSIGCRFCKTFSHKNLDLVLWHESTLHSELFLKERLQCYMCTVHFSEFERYKTHILQRECLNICIGCKVVFPNMNLLVNHINEHHLANSCNIKIKCLSCINCNLKFPTLSEKNEHICPKRCNFCDVSFKSYSLFYNHLHEIHRKVSYVCNSCSANFIHFSDYKVHIQSQICQKCKLCQMTVKVSELSSHKCKIHPLPPVTYSIHVPVPKDTQTMPSNSGDCTKCELCQQVFPDSFKFQSHLHGNDFCFGCRLCVFVGTTKDSIIQHVLTKHSKNLQVSVLEEPEEIKLSNLDVETYGDDCDKLSCELCSQFVDTEEELRLVHRVSIQCSLCKERVQCKFCFAKHLSNNHSSMCKLCQAYFDFPQLHVLKRHSANMVNVPVEQSLHLLMCSNCNAVSFDKKLLGESQNGICGHSGTVWQFEL